MSVHKKAINSGKWVTISTVVQSVIQFAQIAILARLLDPTAFGIVSMSVLFLSFFGVLADLGFSNSIIYKQEKDQKILSTLYYVNILLGVTVFAVIYMLSPLVVHFYNEPRLEKVLNTSAMTFIFVYFGSVQGVLLKKELQFKLVAIIDIAGCILGFPLTIFLAYNGYAELSIVYGTILTQVIRTCLEIYLGRHLFIPKFYFCIVDIRDHLRFGIFNLGESLLNFLQNNWDNLIIGKILGARYLGIYTLALQLGYYPVSKLNPLILQVAYPIVAKLKDDAVAFRRTYIGILDIVSYFNYPLLAGIYITAESVVPIVYGKGWEETFPLIKIFVIVSALSCLAHPLFTLAYSKGKPKYLFYLSLVTLFLKIPLVYIFGLYWSVAGVAIAILATTLISLMLNFLIVNLLIGSYFMDFLKNLLFPIGFCAGMLVIIYGYKEVVGYEGLLHTTAQIILGGLTYISLTLKFKYTVKEVRNIFKSL